MRAEVRAAYMGRHIMARRNELGQAKIAYLVIKKIIAADKPEAIMDRASEATNLANPGHPQFTSSNPTQGIDAPSVAPRTESAG